MAKKQSIAEILMSSEGYQKSLGKISGQRSNFLGIVQTINLLAIHEELIKIRTLLQGRSIDSAKRVKHEETDDETEARVAGEVEEAKAEHKRLLKEAEEKEAEEDNDDNDNNDNDNNDDNDDNDNDNNDDNDDEEEEKPKEKKKLKTRNKKTNKKNKKKKGNK